jgi:hypothetical protein
LCEVFFVVATGVKVSIVQGRKAETRYQKQKSQPEADCAVLFQLTIEF